MWNVERDMCSRVMCNAHELVDLRTCHFLFVATYPYMQQNLSHNISFIFIYKLVVCSCNALTN